MNLINWSSYVFPSWCTTNEAKAFCFGIAFGGVSILVGVCFRWFRRVGNDLGPSSND